MKKWAIKGLTQEEATTIPFAFKNTRFEWVYFCEGIGVELAKIVTSFKVLQ
ncbi:MAG: hypothetical protein V3V31_15575 [Methylococcales bacterium]